MNSLKSALAKDKKVSDSKVSDVSSSMKKFSKTKSDSMWALDMEEKAEQPSLEADEKLQLLSKLVKKAAEKDLNLSNITFERLVEDFQDGLGKTSSSKSEISSYLVLEDKITDLMDLHQKSNPQLYCSFIMKFCLEYLDTFHEKVEVKISQLRSKEKQTDLSDFNKIVDRKFKKKPDYLDVGGIRVDINTKSRQKSKQMKKNSNEKKLSRLFSKEKGLKSTHSAAKEEEHDDYLLSETMVDHKEGISFSTVMSTSVAVKQRKPRQKTSNNHHYGTDLMGGSKTADKKNANKGGVENQQDGEKTDKAFIFYRPKKNAKK